jgi:hypothetical protein
MPGNAAPEELARLQKSFAAHIRNPQSVAAPEGIEDRRMGIYRELFFNNICNLLAANFPVLKTLYSADAWTVLCREFYSEYRCHTPLFPEIPREFLKYLQDHRQQRQSDLALTLDETEIDSIEFDPDGDLLTGIPVLSPLALPLSYHYPVHRIRADYQPQSKTDNPTHLLVWRQQDYKVKFMELNQMSLLLLNEIQQKPERTGLEMLTDIARIINHPRVKVVVDGGSALLNELRTKQVILGTRT